MDFKNNNHNQLMQYILEAEENCLTKFVEYITKETGLSRECSIQYIKKFFNLDFNVREVNGKCCIVLEPRWKSVEELLYEDNNMDDDCIWETII